MSQTKTIKLDSPSSLLRFEGEWNTGGFDGDPELHNYDGTTFAFTKGNHSRVSFNFTGHGVILYGANRVNHGRYQVYLDNEPKGPFHTDGKAPLVDQGLFKTRLFNWTGQDGEHVVTLENWPVANQTNSNDPTTPLIYIDLDYAEWNSTIEHVENLQIRAADPDHFVYSDASWTTSSPDSSGASGGGQFTTRNGSSVTITFSGDRILLYGPLSTSSAAFSVKLDDAAHTFYNYTPLPNAKNTNNQLIYASTGIGAAEAGNHSLTLTTVIVHPEQAFEVAYAEVDSVVNHVSSPSPSTSGTNSQPDQASAGSRRMDGATIAGIVLGVLAGVILFGLVAFLWRAWQRRKREREQMKDDLFTFTISPSSPKGPIDLSSPTSFVTEPSTGQTQKPLPPVPDGYGGWTHTRDSLLRPVRFGDPPPPPRNVMRPISERSEPPIYASMRSSWGSDAADGTGSDRRALFRFGRKKSAEGGSAGGPLRVLSN